MRTGSRPEGFLETLRVSNCLGFVPAHATIADCSNLSYYPYTLEAFALNFFTRNKAGAETVASKPVPATFLTLPPLKSDFDSGNSYIVPRVCEQASGAVTHLDNALGRYARAILIGASGLGKTSGLYFIAAQENARVLSFADFHVLDLPQKFENERCVLLDDVSEPAHVTHLEALAQKFPNAKIWAATRDAQLVPHDFVALELQTLNEREIVSFAHVWIPLRAEKGHGAKRINRAAQDFVASVQANAGTRELAITPLYLYLLLQVYQPASKEAPQRVVEKVTLPMVGGNAATPFDVPQRTRVAQLPSRRAPLFEEYVRAKLAGETDPDFSARAVEGIALSTKRGQVASKEHLARGYGLLVERSNGRVEFKLSMLHDFLAARALRRNPDFEPMREQIDDPVWRDVVLFYAGLGQADEIVTHALERNDLKMAAAALAETAEPPAKLLEQTVKALVARAWDDHDEGAMHALGSLRSNMASDFFAGKLRDKNAEVRHRAAYILGKLHTDRALEYLLPQLRDPSDDVRVQVLASLGASRSERVVEPLLVALRGDPRVASSDTRMKIAAAQALGEYGTDKAVPALIVDLQVSDGDVRQQSMIALDKIRGGFATKPLTEIARTDKRPEVREAAGQVLKDMHGL